MQVAPKAASAAGGGRAVGGCRNGNKCLRVHYRLQQILQGDADDEELGERPVRFRGLARAR